MLLRSELVTQNTLNVYAISVNFAVTGYIQKNCTTNTSAKRNSIFNLDSYRK